MTLKIYLEKKTVNGKPAESRSYVDHQSVAASTAYPRKNPYCCLLILIVLCAVVSLGSLHSASASAGDWERLPDGRVIIEVKGVRLALPSTGSDVDLIRFHDPGLRWHKTLRGVIAAPDEARKVLAEMQRITLHIPNVANRSDLFLSRFARSEFRSFAADIIVGNGAQANCESWEREFLRLQATLTNVGAGPDGWAEVKQGSRPVSLVYLRVGKIDVQPSFTNGLSCDVTGMCHVSKCVGHNVGISYQFARRVFDRPAWQMVNGRASDVFKFLLIDLPK